MELEINKRYLIKSNNFNSVLNELREILVLELTNKSIKIKWIKNNNIMWHAKDNFLSDYTIYEDLGYVDNSLEKEINNRGLNDEDRKNILDSFNKIKQTPLIKDLTGNNDTWKKFFQEITKNKNWNIEL